MGGREGDTAVSSFLCFHPSTQSNLWRGSFRQGNRTLAYETTFSLTEKRNRNRFFLLVWRLTLLKNRLVFFGSRFPHGSQHVAQLFPLSLGADVSANLEEKHTDSQIQWPQLNVPTQEICDDTIRPETCAIINCTSQLPGSRACMRL